MITRALRQFGATSARGAVAILDQAVVSVASFAAALFVGRSGGPDELGSYALVLAIVSAFVVAQQSLVTTPFITLRRRDDPPAPRAYAGGSLVNALGLAALGTAVLVVSGLVARTAGADHLVGPMLWAGLALPFFMVREFVRRWYFAHLRFGSAIVVDASFAALQIGLLAAAAATDRLTASSAYVITAVSNAAVVLPALVALRGPLGIERASIGTSVKRNWEFGRWVAIAELSVAGRNAAMQWLLTLLQSVAANGVFASALATIRFTNPLVLGITNIGEPRIVKGLHDGGPSEVRRLVRKLTLLSALALLPLLVILVGFGARIVGLLFGEEFAVDAGVVVPMSIAVFVGALIYPMGSAVQAMGRPDLNAAIRATGTVVSVAAAVVLIPRWGVMGAGVSLLAAQLLAAVLRAIAYSRVMGAATRRAADSSADAAKG